MDRNGPLEGLSEIAETASGWQEIAEWLEVPARRAYLANQFRSRCGAKSSHQDPEDVAGEFIARLPKTYDSWQRGKKTNFLAYFSISYLNFCREKCRKCREHLGIFTDALVDEQTAVDHFRALAFPEVEAVLADDIQLLERALQDLDFKHSRVLRLELAGFSPKEIASRLDQVESTVRSWLHRGRQRLDAAVFLRMLRFDHAHIRDWPAACRALRACMQHPAGSIQARIWARVPEETRTQIERVVAAGHVDFRTQVSVLNCLNGLLVDHQLARLDATTWASGLSPTASAVALRLAGAATHSIHVNRIILEDLLESSVIQDGWLRRTFS